MKLEPVAWRLQKNGEAFTTLHQNLASKYEHTNGQVVVTPLYAIPPGYVLVPAPLLTQVNATMLEWAKKYGEHNPAWMPPARVCELAEQIEAMLAAANCSSADARTAGESASTGDERMEKE